MKRGGEGRKHSALTPASKARAEHFAKATAKHLIPRIGGADEVADGILFVIKNDFVTGTTVDVDGGALII